MKTNALFIVLVALVLSSCANSNKSSSPNIIADNIAFAEKQIGHQVKIIEESGKVLNPRTVHCNEIEYVPIEDWTSGFFPGTMWYMYELTGDEKWKTLGVKYTEELDSVKF